MVQARVSYKYIHFALLYTDDHIFHILPIKHLVNKDGETTTPHKLATGKNLQYQNHVFYYVYVLYEKQLHMFKQRH